MLDKYNQNEVGMSEDDARPDSPEWNDGIRALERYVAVRGSAPVAKGARAKGFALGVWIEVQRGRYWAGRLAPGDVDVLERVPGWSWNGPHERQWRERFHALARYVKVNGGAALDRNLVVNHLHLGEWAMAQRASYAAGTLPKRASTLLESIPGWNWDLPETTQRSGSRKRGVTLPFIEA
jgi:hypothetical protein